jgi:N-acetylglucosamine transport system permease protein
VRHGRYPFVAGFLVVPVVLYAVFVISPYAQTFFYSFTDWRGVSNRINLVGFDNYVALLNDDVFRRALGHNGVLLLVLPLVTIVLALFLAFMLNVGGRGNRASVVGVRGAAFYKVVYFFPVVLSVAILAVLWQAVYRGDQGGLLNGLLMKLRIVDEQRPWAFVASPAWVLWCVIAVLVWAGVGFYLVLFSTAMQSIPRDLFEAAILDGASRGQTFFRVTLPLVWDNIQVAWVYLAIAAMDAFALVYILTPASGGGGGGPDHASEVVGTHLYRTAFFFGRTGYACAMGVTVFFITLLLAILALRLTRRERIEL